MARCHRIGQERDVTVYRLLSRNTYEEAIFQTASRKVRPFLVAELISNAETGYSACSVCVFRPRPLRLPVR